jgi:hypothetical protein
LEASLGFIASPCLKTTIWKKREGGRKEKEKEKKTEQNNKNPRSEYLECTWPLSQRGAGLRPCQ